MSKLLMNAVIAAGSVAIVLATTGPALAAPSNAVYLRNGIATSSSVAFTATNTNAFQILNLRSNVPMVCAAGNVTLGGTITLGTARPVRPVTTITSANFKSCTFLGSAPVTVSPSLPWNVNAPNTSTSPAPPQGANAAATGQLTAGTVTGVSATATIGSCNVGFGNGSGGTGAINPATYKNGSSTTPSTISILTTSTASSATLGVNSTSTSPCIGGQIVAGDKAQISTIGTPGTAPVVFNIVPASGGPLNIEAYNTSTGF